MRVSQLDRESVRGQDSHIFLTDHFPMAHAQPPRRWPVILPLPRLSQLQPGNPVPVNRLAILLIAGSARPSRPADRWQVFLDADQSAAPRPRTPDTRSFRSPRAPAPGACGFQGPVAADRGRQRHGCRARVDQALRALPACVSTDPLTTPPLFATGLRPSRTKTASTQARTLRCQRRSPATLRAGKMLTAQPPRIVAFLAPNWSK